MRSALLLFVLLGIFGTSAIAQDIRYVSDKQFVPLRSGPGNDYRIIHRGIPSGTKMTVARTSDDNEWAEITTARGTSGWIRSQYLMADVPAALQLDSAKALAQSAQDKNRELEEELNALRAERTQLTEQVSSSDSDLEALSAELSQIKQVSGRALQMDIDNRRLVEESEKLRSNVEMLQSENQRLQDKLRNDEFINGALAVLLGVIIALVAPRLMPKKKRNSSWA